MCCGGTDRRESLVGVQQNSVPTSCHLIQTYLTPDCLVCGKEFTEEGRVHNTESKESVHKSELKKCLNVHTVQRKVKSKLRKCVNVQVSECMLKSSGNHKRIRSELRCVDFLTVQEERVYKSEI